MTRGAGPMNSIEGDEIWEQCTALTVQGVRVLAEILMNHACQTPSFKRYKWIMRGPGKVGVKGYAQVYIPNSSGWLSRRGNSDNSERLWLTCYNRAIPLIIITIKRSLYIHDDIADSRIFWEGEWREWHDIILSAIRQINDDWTQKLFKVKRFTQPRAVVRYTCLLGPVSYIA